MASTSGWLGAVLAVGCLSLSCGALAQTPPSLNVIPPQSVDEGQPVTSFSVAGAFNPGSCFIASPGPDVAVSGLGALPAAGTLAAGATGNGLTFTSNTGLANGSFPVTLTFNYQCAIGGPVSQLVDTNGLTITINPFSPGTISIVAAEDSGANAITAGILAPGRTYDGVTIRSGPSNGTVTVGAGPNPPLSYTPTPHTFGTDKFTFVLTQGGFSSAVGTVTVTVTEILPTAVPVTATVTGSTPTLIPVSQNDIDGPFNRVSIAAAPAHGTATPNGLGVTYTANPGYAGPDQFTYYVFNAVGRSAAPAPVNVTVLPAGTVPASPPLTASTPEGKPVSIPATAQATGTPTSLAIATRPSHGTATAAFPDILYTPAAGYAGPDNFSFTLSNASGTSAPIPVTVTVAAAALPTAKPLATTTPAGTPVTIDLTQGASGGPFTAAAIVQPPPAVDGTARLQGLSVVFTPAATFSGTTSLLYTLSNAAGSSAPTVLAITVGARQLPPPGQTPDTSALLNDQLDITRRFYEVQLQNFGRRLEDLHHGARGFSLSASAMRVGGPTPGGGGPTGESGPAASPAAGGGGHAMAAESPAGSGDAGAAGGSSTGGTGAAAATGAAGTAPAAGATSNGGAAASAGGSAGSGGASASAAPAAASGGESGGAGAATGSTGGAAAGVSVAGGAAAPDAGSSGSGSETGTAPTPAASGASADAKGKPTPPAASDSGGIELPDRLGVFMTPLGDIGDRNPEFHHQGFDFSTVGFSIGADWRLSDWAVAGLGGGFTHDDDTIGSDGSRQLAHSINLTAYGTIQATDQIYVDGIMTWANLDFDSKRAVTGAGLYAYGHRTGDQLYGALTGGYEFDDGALTVAPYLRIDLATAVLDRFVETGAGAQSLIVGHETLTDLSTVLGLRGDYAISLEDSILSPHFRIELLHEFLGGSHTSLDYADQLQGPFAKFGADPTDRNNMTIGIGTSWLTENALSITVDYEVLLAYRNEAGHNFTFGITRRF